MKLLQLTLYQSFPVAEVMEDDDAEWPPLGGLGRVTLGLG